MALTKRFRREDIDRIMEKLRTMGAQFGITFADRPFLSNSRFALQAAEFAREQGRFNEFHPAIFSAYFSQGLDIGDLEVLSEIAADAGLDAVAMKNTLQSGKYLPTLARSQEDAARLGVTGVPTFFIQDKKTIVGAQPLDIFRKTLKSF